MATRSASAARVSRARGDHGAARAPVAHRVRAQRMRGPFARRHISAGHGGTGRASVPGHGASTLKGARSSRPSRRLIIESGVAAAAWLGAACRSRSFPRIGTTVEAVPAADAPPVALEIALRAGPAGAVLDPASGRSARIWRFDGKRIAGAEAALVNHADSTLGPTFRVRRGQRLRIDFENALDEPSIVHWHGLQVPEASDGHPRFAVGRGGAYRYDFTVLNRPGLYWYHAHPDRRTGPGVRGSGRPVSRRGPRRSRARLAGSGGRSGARHSGSRARRRRRARLRAEHDARLPRRSHLRERPADARRHGPQRAAIACGSSTAPTPASTSSPSTTTGR